MKLRIVFLCLLLCGCSYNYDYSKRHIDDYLESYCAARDKQYENKGIIFEREIENVGYYAIAKVKSLEKELLISVRQDIGTKRDYDGFNETGPAFDGKSYRVYINEDIKYGHGKNYYLCVIDGYVSTATYKDKPLDVEITDYTLNNVDKSLSSWLITLDKAGEINLDLLKYEIK